MDTKQETSSAKHSLTSVDSVMSNIMQDINFFQSFLGECKDVYKCYPESVENQMVSKIMDSISSLDWVNPETTCILDTFKETWAKTATYFKEYFEKCSDSDNPFINVKSMDLHCTLVTQENLLALIKLLVSFSERAEVCTTLEKNMITEIQECISNLKEAIGNVSNDVKAIGRLKEEIYCGIDETLQEVNNHSKITKAFQKNIQCSKERQAQCKGATTPMKDMKNQPCTNIKSIEDSKPQQKHPEERQAYTSCPGPSTSRKSLEKNFPAKNLPMKQSDKQFDNIVNMYDQMLTKARLVLKMEKEQNEDLKQTQSAIRKNKET